MLDGREVHDNSLSSHHMRPYVPFHFTTKLWQGFFLIWVEKSCGVGLQVSTIK